MKYFFDTEFIEDGATIDLLSLGIVTEDGRELYLCNIDAKLDHADEWVIYNVFPQLPVFHARENGWKWNAPKKEPGEAWPKSAVVVPRYEMRNRILAMIETDEEDPEFWAYYADYDWVALCQIFGRMIDLPKRFPKYCMDVKQLCKSLGDPKLPEQDSLEHVALNDAKWTKQAYEFLVELEHAKATSCV